MNTTSPTLRLRCSGPLAIFTRPELKAERFSYPVPTPSTLRGIFDAVLWKPAIAWRIQRIHVLKPIKFSSFRRNEVNNKAIAPTNALITSGGQPKDYCADEDRAQRNTVALSEVDYLVEARFIMTPRAGEGDNVTKFVEMFQRRLEKGQCFQQPYFGCRECAADVMPPKGDEKPISETDDFGIMLWDIQFGSNGARPENRSLFYWAKMEDGVIEVPTDAESARASLLAYNQRKGGR